MHYHIIQAINKLFIFGAGLAFKIYKNLYLISLNKTTLVSRANALSLNFPIFRFSFSVLQKVADSDKFKFIAYKCVKFKSFMDFSLAILWLV
ncbi:hypothetical protein LBC_15010 [Campylobacter sp. 19-13652]|nr:hypothetical protein LBC_15010 [Campylobacter sp. 19-13652]